MFHAPALHLVSKRCGSVVQHARALPVPDEHCTFNKGMYREENLVHELNQRKPQLSLSTTESSSGSRLDCMTLVKVPSVAESASGTGESKAEDRRGLVL